MDASRGDFLLFPFLPLATATSLNVGALCAREAHIELTIMPKLSPRWADRRSVQRGMTIPAARKY